MYVLTSDNAYTVGNEIANVVVMMMLPFSSCPPVSKTSKLYSCTEPPGERANIHSPRNVCIIMIFYIAVMEV